MSRSVQRIVVPQNRADCARVQGVYVITEGVKLVVIVRQPPPKRFIVQLQTNTGL
jgi:hypothetical protein